MNRLVLIGNGFDLAHGLKTSYADFIHWYWGRRVNELQGEIAKESNDGLCNIVRKAQTTWKLLLSQANIINDRSAEKVLGFMVEKGWCYVSQLPLLDRITKGLESKTWAGIESDYYELLKENTFAKREGGISWLKENYIEELNQQLQFVQDLLIRYLIEITQHETGVHEDIKRAIYAAIESEDIAVGSKEKWESYMNSEIDKDERKLEYKVSDYGISTGYIFDIHDYKKNPWKISRDKDYPYLARLPQQIMLLNFNYTNTIERYLNRDIATIVSIHGELDKPKSIIFGYGDEIDPSFKKLRDLNNGDCLKYVKSMRYLETPNYRNVLSFIESAPFQVLIMGHSCGNSDRTLLNTIFEHSNCVSIKPYYYITDKEKQTDNYTDLIQHISRNFNDMKLMRDRVVNKTQCEPLVRDKKDLNKIL